jgi:hypothetical protein
VITADAGARFNCTHGIGRNDPSDAGAPRERLAGRLRRPAFAEGGQATGLCAADSKSFFSRNGRGHCALRKNLPVQCRFGVKSPHYRAAALLSAFAPISRPQQHGLNATLCAKSGIMHRSKRACLTLWQTF